MTLDEALAELRHHAEPALAAEKARYHKQVRPVLGVLNPALNTLTAGWRKALSVPERVTLADALWRTDIFEARIAAAKLLDQTRIRPDAEVWRLIVSWLPDLDSWAISDHAMTAGQKRLLAEPARIGEIESWTRAESLWIRRAAMVITLPFARMKDAPPEALAIRERVLGWAAGYVDDPEWFIQKSIAWWLRDLSQRDPDRCRAFLDAFGDRMKPFARKEAAKYLPT